MQHYVYMLQCADGSLYAGYTTDIERRLTEHNGQSTQPGARYTRARRPVKLVYRKVFATRSAAAKYEAQLKKLTRAEKLALIAL